MICNIPVVLTPPEAEQASILDFNTEKTRKEAQQDQYIWDLDETKKKGDQMSQFAWDSPSLYLL